MIDIFDENYEAFGGAKFVNGKYVAFEFKREELLYDIGNYAFVEGDILKDEDEHRRHQLIDINEAGNIDLVDRMLALAHSECVEFLYPYSNLACNKLNFLDNRLDGIEDYEIRITVPDGFSRTTVELLEKLIHRYMICRVLAEWISITKPESHNTWLMKLEETKDAIKRSLNVRRGRLRIKQHPF